MRARSKHRRARSAVWGPSRGVLIALSGRRSSLPNSYSDSDSSRYPLTPLAPRPPRSVTRSPGQPAQSEVASRPRQRRTHSSGAGRSTAAIHTELATGGLTPTVPPGRPRRRPSARKRRNAEKAEAATRESERAKRHVNSNKKKAKKDRVALESILRVNVLKAELHKLKNL
jgi:hypothetical protein